MKDKTDAMNMGLSTEDANRGFGDAGTPMSRKAYKNRQLNVAGLLSDEALAEYENEKGDDKNSNVPRGFLPRSNYDDRF